MNKTNLKSKIHVYIPGRTAKEYLGGAHAVFSDCHYKIHYVDGSISNSIRYYSRSINQSSSTTVTYQEIDMDVEISSTLDKPISYVEFEPVDGDEVITHTNDRFYKVDMNQSMINPYSIIVVPYNYDYIGPDYLTYAIVKANSNEEFSFRDKTYFENLEPDTDYIIAICNTILDDTLYNMQAIRTLPGPVYPDEPDIPQPDEPEDDSIKAYVNLGTMYTLGTVYVNTGTKYVLAKGLNIQE